MRTRLLSAALLLLAATASAQVRPQPMLQQFPAAPETCRASVEGNAYHNTVDKVDYVCNGTAWYPLNNAAAILYKRMDLTITQVTALNSTPVAFLPAVTGYFYSTDHLICLHSGRYATSPGNTVLRIIGQAVNFATISAASCLTNATTNGFAGGYVGTAGTGGVSDASTQYCSKGIEVHNLSGNPTVDGSNPGSTVVLVYYYRLLPCYPGNAPVLN